MRNNIGTVVLRCDCNCTMLVIDKYKFEDEIDYSVSMQCSIFDENKLWNRVKMAWKVLRNKEVTFRDLYIENEKDIIKFNNELTALINNDI